MDVIAPTDARFYRIDYNYGGVIEHCARVYTDEECKLLVIMWNRTYWTLGVHLGIESAVCGWFRYPKGRSYFTAKRLVELLEDYRGMHSHPGRLYSISNMHHIERFMSLMYYAPLDIMPLYINHTDGFSEQLATVARWRLALGK